MIPPEEHNPLLSIFPEKFTSLINTSSQIKTAEHPYKHFVFENLFTDPFVERMSESFNQRLSFGLKEDYEANKFVRANPKNGFGYGEDSTFLLVWPRLVGLPFQAFYTKEVIEFFSNLFNVKLTNNIVGAFHHHRPNSPSGAIHNDNFDVNFCDNELINGTNPFCGSVNHTQLNKNDSANVKKLRRAVFAIYYFNNEEWKEGFGGETGLYTTPSARTCIKIPPKNNTMLTFEITPESYHAYMANTVISRNCLVLWFHK